MAGWVHLAAGSQRKRHVLASPEEGQVKGGMWYIGRARRAVIESVGHARCRDLLQGKSIVQKGLSCQTPFLTVYKQFQQRKENKILTWNIIRFGRKWWNLQRLSGRTQVCLHSERKRRGPNRKETSFTHQPITVPNRGVDIASQGMFSVCVTQVLTNETRCFIYPWYFFSLAKTCAKSGTDSR